MSEFEFIVDLEDTPALEPSDLEIAGEDLFLGPIDESSSRYGLRETHNGDFAVVTGPQLAKQSIVRDLINNQGSLPRRPQWGGGLSGLLFKGATQTVRDRTATRARARMLANPRVRKVQEVAASVGESGISLTVRVDTIGGTLDDVIVVKPPGV